jgi:hypothetical protein
MCRGCGRGGSGGGRGGGSSGGNGIFGFVAGVILLAFLVSSCR